MDSTTILVLLGGMIVVLAVVAAVIAAAKRTAPDALQVQAKPLMSERERRAIAMIEAAAPGCRVHAQVAMAALVTLQKQVPKHERTAIRNRFDRKFVDYVVEHKSTGQVLCIIELDDRTHDSAKDIARNRITAAAGYTTVRLPGGEKVTAELVRERISPILPALRAVSKS